MDYYPRPQFERDAWRSLDGTWLFDFDDEHVGLTRKWYERHDYERRITVPFAYQCAASGIADDNEHDAVWYELRTEVNNVKDGILRLHIGASDYATKVWANGVYCGEHHGGYTPFSLDIEHCLDSSLDHCPLRLTIYVEDHSSDPTLPRGKQTFTGRSEGIFYTGTTGIWQSVWLEQLSRNHIESVKYTPDTISNQVRIETELSLRAPSGRLCVEVTRDGGVVAKETVLADGERYVICVDIPDFNDHHYGHWWSPETPNLYDVKLSLEVDGQIVDEVRSYFGMRSVGVEHGRFCVNHMPFETKSVLYQGYYPDSLMTAKSDDELRHDVQLIKDMGFNSVRLHQKYENPRFLYWCDRLGLLVWGEAPNAFDFSDEACRRFIAEWLEALKRDYNHPCIGVWVPLNESWGMQKMKNVATQRWFSVATHALTKALDSSRPVLSNDGWEHTDSDLCTIHDYEADLSILKERYSTVDNVMPGPQGRSVYVGKYRYEGEPILLSEFGGIAFDEQKNKSEDAWGYSGADSSKDFERRVVDIIRTVRSCPLLQGYCYTQFNDVEQEINGLVTMGRKPKLDVRAVASANAGI